MPPAEIDGANVPRRRWTIALLLGFGVLVNYFDRVNLSVSRDALQDSFGISAVMFGYLSSAYNWPICEIAICAALGSVRSASWNFRRACAQQATFKIGLSSLSVIPS